MTTTPLSVVSNSSFPPTYLDFVESKTEELTNQPLEEENNGYLQEYLNQIEIARRAHEQQFSSHLSDRLKQGIQDIHKIAIKNPFLKGLIEGEKAFCAKAYVHYLCGLYVMHIAIEKAQKQVLETHGESSFVIKELFRSETLLEDIKIWSIFSELSLTFADLEINDPLFIQSVEQIAQKNTHEFALHLEEISNKDPFLSIGAVFTLYGTAMSGGQFVSRGLDSGFKCRIQHQNTEDDGTESYESHYKSQILADTQKNESALQTYVEKAISFFRFPDLEKNYHTLFQSYAKQFLSKFKTTIWHPKLDKVLETKKFSSEKEKDEFVSALVKEANHTIDTVLNLIRDMLERLKKET